MGKSQRKLSAEPGGLVSDQSQAGSKQSNSQLKFPALQKMLLRIREAID